MINFFILFIRIAVNGGWISPFAKIRIEKGARIEFGKNNIILRHSTIVAYKGAVIRLGDDVIINQNVTIYARAGVSIGSRVHIAHSVSIIDHDYDYTKKTFARFNDKYIKSMKIIIGDYTWVGAGCCITKGVEIGEAVVIAALTLVRSNISSGTLAYNPGNSSVKTKIIDC